jgi:anti-sigma regulatory factor (Ser/Thr protein kinase)
MEIPSNLGMVDAIVERATRLAFGYELEADAPFVIVLRELLVNAILHGNREDHSRRVCLSIDRINGAELKITVEDEGEGFDYPSLAYAIEEGHEAGSTSGYAAVTRNCHRLEFSESGRRVAAYFFLGGGGGFLGQWEDPSDQ